MPAYRHSGRIRGRKNFDGPRALAAAVIIRAMRDCEGANTGYLSGLSPAQVKAEAARFLQGDMEPWTSILGMDAETDLSHRRWCRAHGLVAGSLIGESD